MQSILHKEMPMSQTASVILDDWLTVTTFNDNLLPWTFKFTPLMKIFSQSVKYLQDASSHTSCVKSRKISLENLIRKEHKYTLTYKSSTDSMDNNEDGEEIQGRVDGSLSPPW